MKTHDSQKHKLGRPNADAARLKKHVLTVRLSDTDLLALHEKSQRTKLSYSAFLREAGLGRELPRPVPEINLKTFQELGRIGSNLNQLLRLHHENNREDFSSDLLGELTRIIQGVRKEVRGK